MRLKELVLGAALAAMALIIPLAFGFLRVYVPPFTATLASHVPVFIAITIGPLAAGVVGLGSTIGFLYVGPVIAARASIHIIFGVLGAYLYRHGIRASLVLLAMLPVHAVGEALIVVPFGFDLYSAGVVVGLGTALHHLVDVGIALTILSLLNRTGWMPTVRL